MTTSPTASIPGCPLCGAAGRPAFTARDRNREIEDRPFHYARCERCTTLWLVDPPADLGRFYPEGYYELPPAERLPALAAGEGHKVALLREVADGGRLVEIGPGFGVFAFAARRAGFDVTGVEMDARCCAYLRDTVGVGAVHSARPAAELERLPPSRAVALWHVIEHVPDPGGLLDAIARHLEPGGVAAISTPNPQSLQMRLLRARWAHVDAPRHLTLIPLGALTERARRSGLRPMRVTLADPAGRHWNRFGWEAALRRRPAAGPPTKPVAAAALGLTLAMRPVEERDRLGAAYTVTFRKEPA